MSQPVVSAGLPSQLIDGIARPSMRRRQSLLRDCSPRPQVDEQSPHNDHSVHRSTDPVLVLSISDSAECEFRGEQFCVVSAAVGGRVALPVDAVVKEPDTDGGVDEDGWVQSLDESERGVQRVVWYKYYDGLSPHFHSFRQRLDRLSGDLLPNMHLDGTGQTLTLSPVLAGDLLESLFIAEVGPVKDDDSNHDSYTIDDMEVFDLNTEKLHPSSRMVYFALETKAIELGPFIRGDPLKIDINDFLEVHHKETHYRWAVEGAIQSVVRLNTPLDHEVVPILTINGLDDDLLGTVIIGTVYGKRDGVPGRVSIGSQRFLIKKDTSRSCQGLPTNRTCTCNPGYELADVACKDIDECQLGTRRCLPNSTCVNTPGSYRCECPLGYHGDGISGCQDTDECVTSIALCDDNAVCVNTLGSYRCICHEGFIGDGLDCLAISEWTSWSLWSSCLISCGRSSRMRYRDCSHPESGMICEGPSVDTEPCESKPCPVDGGWGEWSPWSVCSKSCGGHREKVRACDNPSPTDGGLFCIGVMYQINGCESRSECPVFPRLLKVNGGWSQWSVWSLCSTSCGPGLQSRRRHCGRATSLDDVRNPCDGNPTEMRECDRDFQTCFDALMGVKWGEWEHWSACSQSCGIGRRIRSRQCLTKGRSLGPGCSGANQEQQPCLRSKC